MTPRRGCPPPHQNLGGEENTKRGTPFGGGGVGSPTPGSLRARAGRHQPGSGGRSRQVVLRGARSEKHRRRSRVLQTRHRGRRRLRRRPGRPVHVNLRAAGLPREVGDHRGHPERAPVVRAHFRDRRHRNQIRRRPTEDDKRRPDRRQLQDRQPLRHQAGLQPPDRRAAEHRQREHDRSSLVRARIFPGRLVEEPGDRFLRLRHAVAAGGHRRGQVRAVRVHRARSTEPGCPHFNAKEGYFDVTNKAYATPQQLDLASLGGSGTIPACLLPGAYVSGGTGPWANCNPSELDHSRIVPAGGRHRL